MAALIPDLRKFVVGLEVKNASSVSEATWRKIGGMINFLGHRTHQEKNFRVNGNYGLLPPTSYPVNAIDGLHFFEFDAEIFNIWTYNFKKGVSGITELDLKVKPKGSGSFTSILSTTAKIGPTAPDETWFEIGDTGTGIAAPVLDGGVPYNVNRGDAIRMDLLQAMAEGEHCGMVIHFRPR